MLTAACGQSQPTAPSTPPPPPTPRVAPAVQFSLSGVVSDAVTGGRVSGASVSISAIGQFTGGWSQWHGGEAQTDANGYYEIANLTEGNGPGGPVVPTTVWAYASKAPRSVQPCAATITIVPGGSETLNLAIAQTDTTSPVPSTSFVSPAGSRTISGTIFETAPDGRRPVQGAWVGWEALLDTVVADFRSDAAGRYTLCGLPNTSLTLFAERGTAAGPTYEPTYVTVGPGISNLDIDLAR
jgi:hypothetical protein